MPLMVFNYGCCWEITFLHALFVVAESAILVYYAIILRRDEIVAEKLVEAVSRVEQNNDLTLRISEHGGNAIAIAFNEIMGKFSLKVQEVGEAWKQVNTIARQVGGIADSAESEINSQHAQTEQAATSITEMSQTFQSVANSTETAARLATSANRQAGGGDKLFHNATTAPGELQAAMS